MSQPKTLFLYEEIPEKSFFFELEGDYSHLNGIYANGSDDREKVDELTALVHRDNDEIQAFKDENPEVKDGDKIYLKVTKLDAPTKDWDHFVKCGFIL